MTANGIPPAPPDKLDEPPAAIAPRRGSALRSGLVPGANAALLLLLFINMFNYIDRQVLSALEKPIQNEFFPNGLARPLFWFDGVAFRMGLLSTAFMVAFMLLAPVFGRLADRMSRWKLMAFGVAVWSLASGASGLAGAYVALFLTRCFVGVGEAAYGPAAPAVISDMYPESRRGAILAYFYAAIPVGSALGVALGGLMLWLTGSWRWAFYLVVPPGLLLAALCLFMREPKRGESDPAAKPHLASWRDYLIILQTPSFVLTTLGYTAATFAIGGIGYWMPAYCEDRGQPNLTATQAFGGILVVSGLLATLAGGWTGDALRRRFPGSYLLVSGAGMIVAFPLMLAFLVTPFPAAYAVMFLAVFCLFFNTGPVNTVVANVTHPALRQRLRPGHPDYPPFRRHLFADDHGLRRRQSPCRRGGRGAAVLVGGLPPKQSRHGFQLSHRVRHDPALWRSVAVGREIPGARHRPGPDPHRRAARLTRRLA